MSISDFEYTKGFVYQNTLRLRYNTSLSWKFKKLYLASIRNTSWLWRTFLTPGMEMRNPKWIQCDVTDHTFHVEKIGVDSFIQIWDISLFLCILACATGGGEGEDGGEEGGIGENKASATLVVSGQLKPWSNKHSYQCIY